MRVARKFRRARFWTQQSEYYSDPETEEQREIDLVARAQADVGGCLVRLSLCAECKATPDKPWIIFTSSELRLADRARIAQRAASYLGSEFLMSVSKDPRYQKLALFRLPERSAFGVTQAFSSGKDVAYQACIGAAKSSVAQAKEADLGYKRDSPFFEIIVPVVVIEGQLFECYLDPSDQIAIGEVTSGTLVWRNPVVGMPHTIIKVVTYSGLDGLISEASEAADLLLTSRKEVGELLSKKGLEPRE